MPLPVGWVALAGAYLLGSIPFGLIFSRLRGVDPRAVGSGNIGATNVLRVVGKREAVLTLAGDFLKGAAAVWLARRLSPVLMTQMIAGLFAILGHCFPIFLKFRGGKGVATGFGVLLALYPGVALATFLFWAGTAFAWRISSLAALISFSLLPVTTFVVLYRAGRQELLSGLIFSVAVAFLIVLRHRENIERLIAGKEGIPKSGGQ